MSTIIYLYLKTHNRTGLKYLGKTVSDPFKYKGSGTYWLKHINKHGNDVSTKIIFSSDSKHAIKLAGLYYSDLWNVVDSADFANLIEETGEGVPIGNIPWNKGKKCPEFAKFGKDNPSFGKPSWNKGLPKEQNPRYEKESPLKGRTKESYRYIKEHSERRKDF